MKELAEVKMRWIGITDLLYNRRPTPDNADMAPLLERIKEINEKKDKDKTDAERAEMHELQWRTMAYFDPDLGLYIPSDNIERCLKDGAGKIRKGKSVEAASFVSETKIKVGGVDYQLDMKRMYGDHRFKFEKYVKIPPRTGKQVWLVSPKVPAGWTLEFTLQFDDETVNEKDLIKSAECAGRLVGLGRWRPKYGRFEVEVI